MLEGQSPSYSVQLLPAYAGFMAYRIHTCHRPFRPYEFPDFAGEDGLPISCHQQVTWEHGRVCRIAVLTLGCAHAPLATRCQSSIRTHVGPMVRAARLCRKPAFPGEVDCRINRSQFYGL